MNSIYEIALNCPPGLTHPRLEENRECARIDALLEEMCNTKTLLGKRKRAESDVSDYEEEANNVFNRFECETLQLTRQVADNYNNDYVNSYAAKYGGYDELQGGDNSYCSSYNSYGGLNENRLSFSMKFYQPYDLMDHTLVLDLLETGSYRRPESTDPFRNGWVARR